MLDIGCGRVLGLDGKIIFINTPTGEDEEVTHMGRPRRTFNHQDANCTGVVLIVFGLFVFGFVVWGLLGD